MPEVHHTERHDRFAASSAREDHRVHQPDRLGGWQRKGNFIHYLLPVHGVFLLLLWIMMPKVWSIFVEGQVSHDLSTAGTERFRNGCKILPPLALCQTFVVFVVAVGSLSRRSCLNKF